MTPPRLSTSPYALLLVATACLVLVLIVYDGLFVQHVPLSIVTAWRADTMLGFLAKCTLVVVPLYTVLQLATNKWFDWLGIVKTRQAALSAQATASNALATAETNSAAIADHARRINGALDGLVAQAASAAAISTLDTYRRTNSIDAAADAGQKAALQAVKAVKALNGLAAEPHPGATADALPPGGAVLPAPPTPADPAPAPPAKGAGS